jgi:hypothetical protein
LLSHRIMISRYQDTANTLITSNHWQEGRLPTEFSGVLEIVVGAFDRWQYSDASQ